MRVWAPSAARVELVVKDAVHPMERADDGWWASSLSPPHGTDYQFSVDGQKLPDPRSHWQALGVHGPSRVLDHSRFGWQHDRWHLTPFSDAIVYELHMGTFSPKGNFAGCIERLPYLVELGVTHVEFMPVVEFAGDYGWGYDGVCPFAPHHAYGGPEEFKRLVDAAHGLGLGVILDVVYNHLGPCGNYLPKFGPYFSGHYLTPWGPALNFDGPNSDEVRRYFLDNAQMWFREYRVDALRLDAVHAIIDGSAMHVLEELAHETTALSAGLNRDLVLIAESDLNDPRLLRSSEAGGFGLQAQWADDLHHAMHAALTGERQGYYEDFGGLERLADGIRSPFVYAGQYSAFRRRRHGRAPTGIGADHFVTFLQNHDQIGNRAKGERISHLTSFGRAKIGAAISLLSPYVPLLFQGEEWAASSPFQYFVDYRTEPDLAVAVREGRRREFKEFAWDPSQIPDPNDLETFERSKLRWDELSLPDHQEMQSWYKSLLEFRRSKCFADSRFLPQVVRCSEPDQWLQVERGGIAIACNFSAELRSIPYSLSADSQVLLNSAATAPEIHGDRIEIAPESVAVFSVENTT